MKICWDNLEHLVYVPKVDRWLDLNRPEQGRVWCYVDECEECGEPFLTRYSSFPERMARFCSPTCGGIHRYSVDLSLKTKLLYKLRRKNIIDQETKVIRKRAGYLFRAARRRAKQKNIDINIDVSWVMDRLLNGKCEITNIPFSYGHNKTYAFRPSIDRIDNSKGYIKDNCRLILYMLNTWKGEATDKELYEAAKKFIEYYDRSN